MLHIWIGSALTVLGIMIELLRSIGNCEVLDLFCWYNNRWYYTHIAGPSCSNFFAELTKEQFYEYLLQATSIGVRILNCEQNKHLIAHGYDGIAWSFMSKDNLYLEVYRNVRAVN